MVDEYGPSIQISKIHLYSFLSNSKPISPLVYENILIFPIFIPNFAPDGCNIKKITTGIQYILFLREIQRNNYRLFPVLIKDKSAPPPFFFICVYIGNVPIFTPLTKFRTILLTILHVTAVLFFFLTVRMCYKVEFQPI